MDEYGATVLLLFFLLAGFVIFEAVARRLKGSELKGEIERLGGALRRQADAVAQIRAELERRPPEAGKPAEPARPAEPLPTVLPPRPEIPPAPPVPPASPVPPSMGWGLPVEGAASRTQPPPASRAPSPAPPPAAPPSATARAPAPPPGRPGPESPLASLRHFNFESLVGVRLFSAVAGIAILVAAVTFVSFSIREGWLTPPIRMALGLLVGIGLLVACENKRAQAYRATANALTAGGLATLFVTLFAAHKTWELIPNAFLAFALLALVTAVAVLLSIRRDSTFIALLGLAGGFLTPILLSTGEDRPVGLFSYLLLLDVGLAWVAYRKRWPVLTALSLAFTTLYQLGWVGKFFAGDHQGRIPLAMSVFLIFPLLGFGALLLSRRRDGREGEPPLFAQTALFGTIPPAVFALYLSMVPDIGSHYLLFFGFLVLVAAGLAFVAAFIGPEWIHTAGAGMVLLVTACWLAASYPELHGESTTAWPVVLLVIGLLVAHHLGTPLLLKRLGKPFQKEGKIATYAAPLLLFAFPALAMKEPAAAGPLLFFGALFVISAAMATYAVFFQDGPVHFLAAPFVVLSEIVWSAKYGGPERLLPMLLVYGGFALFYVAVPIAAERLGRPLRSRGSGSILLFATLGLLFFLVAGPVALHSFWAMALLLGILDAGLFYEASRGNRPLLALGGVLVSFAVILVWWMNVPSLDWLVPALAVLAGIILLAVGGSIWARKQAERAGEVRASSLTGKGPYLGLFGHLFLLGVVCSPELAASAAPWLAVLAVLDLALGAAALATGQASLHLCAMAASGLILFAWAARPLGVPSDALGPIGAALALALFALAFVLLARRRGTTSRLYEIASGTASFLALAVVALVSLSHPIAAPFPALVAAYVLLQIGLLALAWGTGHQGWTLGAVLPFAICAAAWLALHDREPARLLWLATPVYLLFLANPLALGPRARRDRLPFLASLAGSFFFFWFGWHAFRQAQLGAIVGVLPVAQAFLLVPHVWILLRMEPASERDLGRLALVAGGVLAFVTVAIPLQLEKQWITLGWALLGAALAWLYRRLPHRGILIWLAVLLAAVLVRLSLNPAVLDYHPRSATRILNWYLYTWLVAAACFYAAATLLRTTEDRLFSRWRLSHLCSAGGTLLLFLLLNIEIADFFSTGESITFSLSAGLAQNLTYTIGWGLFAIGLLAAGVIFQGRAARIAAISLLVITIFKAFLYDLSELHDLYRVASFVGLAFCLALVAVVLQKFVLQPRPPPPPETAP